MSVVRLVTAADRWRYIKRSAAALAGWTTRRIELAQSEKLETAENRQSDIASLREPF